MKYQPMYEITSTDGSYRVLLERLFLVLQCLKTIKHGKHSVARLKGYLTLYASFISAPANRHEVCELFVG